MLERNLKWDWLRNGIRKFFVIFFYTFLSPYFFFFRMIDETNIYNDCIVFCYFASVLPAFIAFEVLFIIFDLIIAVPGLLLSQKFRGLFNTIESALMC